MNDLHQELVDYIFAHTKNATLVMHQASRTSEESAQARQAAGAGIVTGAKALLIKLDTKGEASFAVAVLPSMDKLDSKALKTALKTRVTGFRNFRFATPEEMVSVARGVEPGRMPPFGRPIFPAVAYTFVDSALATHPEIGFNAAHFEKSIVMPTADYLSFVVNDGVFSFSQKA